MNCNGHVYGFLEYMEMYEELDETLAIAKAIFGDPSDPTPPQAVPVDHWYPLEETPDEYLPLEETPDEYLPLEETPDEYLPLAATGLTLEQLLEELLPDLVAPLMYPQQSLLQPGPVHCQTQFDNQQTETPTKHLEVKLRPIGVFDQKVIYGAPGDRVPPPVNARSTQKRKRVIEEDDDTQYVKKPPNAFMLYRQEQRPKVLAEHRNSDSAAVNTIIGQMFDNQQTETHTKHLEVKLTPIGVFDQKVIYGAPGDRVPPPVNARSTQKRKRVIEEDDDTQYVKKPPNAFMLYLQEQRPKVLAERRNSDSAAVNTVIGQMWKALSRKQQEKYYEEYGRLRQIHNQLYPGWSSRDNYGKKRKRSPRRSSKTVNGVSAGSGRPPRFAPSWRN